MKQGDQRLLVEKGVIIGRGVDYLTVTVPRAVGQSLVAETVAVEDGKAWQGYRRTERRMCMGGYLWRRWEPVQASPRFGTDYETLEADGEAAAWLARRVDPSECRAARVDPCVDLQVPADLVPLDVVLPLTEGGTAEDLLRGGKCAHSGMQIWPDGRGPQRAWTWYVGVRGGERAARLYLKSVQNPHLYPEETGTVLRCELELRGAVADAWWRAWRRDAQSGWAAAGRHWWEITGRQLLPIGDLPELPEKPKVEAAQSLLHAVVQTYAVATAAMEAGIDLVGLYRTWGDLAPRTTAWRREKRRRELEEAGAEATEAWVRTLLEQRARLEK